MENKVYREKIAKRETSFTDRFLDQPFFVLADSREEPVQLFQALGNSETRRRHSLFRLLRKSLSSSRLALHLGQLVAMVRQVFQDRFSFPRVASCWKGIFRDCDDRGNDRDDLGQVLVELFALRP